ncbi:MAG: primosomal protein N', partial [Campylobacterota bacterium]|nr:primosomal protein N' [Campylobacterota bacterium]
MTYHSSSFIKPYQQVLVLLKNKNIFGYCVGEVDKPSFDTLEIVEIEDFFLSQKQVQIAEFISSYYFCSMGEALALFSPGCVIAKKELGNDPLSEESNIKLSDKQTEAFSFLKKNPISLLFGDTGSGKTEIYMKYFEEVLFKGKRTIFLMPEISLTPQMQIRLEEHFGNAVVMWHSKLTKKQKEKNLEKIYDGSAKIIAGPRSALFLPVEDLGLIVVDEEHDESYKASSRPRYHARDMAIYMGNVLKIPVLLGSATPSLSSYVKFPHCRLKGGHFQSSKRFIFEPHSEAITPLIEQLVEKTVEAESQGMVFIPTRANFKYLICDSCGFTYECPYCSVGMSLHRYARAVKCHYCNYSEPIPQVCPKCHSGNLTSSRLGTAEAVEHF